MSSDAHTKRCSKCQAQFPATPAFFQPRDGGLRAMCRTCLNAQKVRSARRRRAADPEKLQAYERERRRANPDKARQAEQKYRAKNREKIAASQRRNYDAHAEERKEYSRRWRQTNHEQVLESRRRYRETHLTEERAKDREHARRRRKEQREAVYASNHRQRARRRAAPGHFTAADIERIRKAQKGRCYYCGKKEKLTVDHIVPLSRGGSNWPDNIVLACKSCNSSKGGKLPHEWPDGGPPPAVASDERTVA